MSDNNEPSQSQMTQTYKVNSSPERRRDHTHIGDRQQGVQRVQVLDKGNQVSPQSRQHFVVAVLTAVDQKVATEHR